MKTEFSLETGPQEAGDICDCCGTRSTTVHGFVYASGDAFAIYYAGWSIQHPERGVTMAIASGTWSEGSGPADRVSIGVQARSHETEIHFSVLEPSQSPWGKTQLFGEMLLRDKALQHSSLRTTLEIAELVVREDPRVRSFLWGLS
jgi:hypothetical protein